jgi:hypothetical protein
MVYVNATKMEQSSVDKFYDQDDLVTGQTTGAKQAI